MSVTKTIEFLPAIFQTDANRKFLNATLDQLVNEPSLGRINGYIGRKFSPAYKSSDRYIREPSADRTNYQLEPSVVVKNKITNDVEFHVTYPEVLQKLGFYGAKTANQDTLWSSEYYSFNPHVNLDKLVNFNEYYWLPNGPDAIDLYSGAVDMEREFQLTTDAKTNAYNFTGTYDAPNPDLILARGGTYTFVVDQPGRPFWIQTNPGLSGKQEIYTNYSSREILGVTNNGTDQGTVTFSVPSSTEQDFFINMPKLQDVDLVTHLTYNQLQNQLLSSVVKQHGGIDDQYLNLHNKTLIFALPSSDPSDWTPGGFDQTGFAAINFDEPYTVPYIDRYGDPYWTPGGVFDSADGFDQTLFDEGQVVSMSNRYGIWRIKLVPVDANNSDYIIQLNYSNDLPVNYKVTVTSGSTYGGTDWYKNTGLVIVEMPLITSNLDILYYQDGVNDFQVGVIRLVDSDNSNIDVNLDILNKVSYVSPNGVMFSNGMKVRFDSQVVPVSYADNEYYVEGVGKGITLTKVTDLTPPVDYDIENPDYVLINRSSLERSPWAWSNRWFHKDIVNLAAHFNRTVPNFDQSTQARRPIVEFDANIQLFDFGSIGKAPVDIFDATITEPFKVVENAIGFWVDGVELTAGMRVIFAADIDPITRNNIWVVSFVDTDNTGPKIHLSLADDGEVGVNNTVMILDGKLHKNKNFWFNGTAWVEGQVKTKKNQSPLFDVFDQNNNSFGDTAVYPIAKISRFFQGCKIFGYSEGTGTVDPILGIPLAYKNVINIGDIKFDNFFDSDSFDYTIDKINYTTKVNTGLLRKNNLDGTHTRCNVWDTVVEPSRQYQQLSFIYDGVIDNFFVDVMPKYEHNKPSLLIYVNHTKLTSNQYSLSANAARSGFNVVVSRALIKAGDKIDILVYSDTQSKIGAYQIPANLDLNAQNKNFTEVTLGNMRTHVNALVVNSMKFAGYYPGNSNLRDLSVTAQGGTILQQSAPVTYAAMFLADEQANFVDSVLYASQEYTRFKSKFLENVFSIAEEAMSDPVGAVDTIIKNINISKNSNFPWFYSDMVPAGDNKITNVYTVYSSGIREYEISVIFNTNKLSNYAVLVYHNGKQLILGRDYTFSQTAAAVIIGDAVALEVSDQLLIVEYTNTDGCYIPETPTKLGLYPKFLPEIFVDKSYQPVKTTYTIPSLGAVEIKSDFEFAVEPWYGLVQDSDIWVKYDGNEVTFQIDKTNKNSYTIILDTPVADPHKVTIGVSQSQFVVNSWHELIQDTDVKVTVSGIEAEFQVVKTADVNTIVLDTPAMENQVVVIGVPYVVIRGHDGSIAPVFGDLRDTVLLELERRIYNNIKAQYDDTNFGIHNVIPGKFRDTGYTLPEYNTILSKSFLNWAGANRLIYSDNADWNLTDEFTWNYRRFSDVVNGEELPGSWKACYMYFYDTYRPNTHPWEMLGFSEKPDWWEDRYGPAPYTGGNLVMWGDLSKGYIAGGETPGVDDRFARPDLLSIIPVDVAGNLLPPAGLLVARYLNAQSNSSWSFGNMGPVEVAWRNSSDYPFAIQRAMALSKPGRYFGLGVNTQVYQYNTELSQYLNTETAQRLTQNEIVITGELDNSGNVLRSSGYLNWIAGYLTSMGIDPVAKLSHYLDDFEVQLSYRMAGYSDKNKLKVFAEQNSPSSTSDSIMIPDSDYDLLLNKSTPLRKAVYSAVIIERTQTGFRVSGYDTTNPVFYAVPPIPNDSDSQSIDILNRRVTIYGQYNKFKVTVPYGFEFTSEQQVANFLSGYGIYLQSQGFRFETYDSDLQEIRNWTLSIKEFLFWAQQGWNNSSVLVLSPSSNAIDMVIDNAIVDGISDSVYGSKIVNQNFEIIKSNAYGVVRDRNRFSVTPDAGQSICFAELNVVQYEHLLVFNNTTMFNDVIYVPESGSRQYRLKLVGFKTSDWTGNLDPRGFVYNNGKVDAWQSNKDYLKGDLVSYKGFFYTAIKNLSGELEFGFTNWKRIDNKSFKVGLLNNFATNSLQSENFYNIDGVNLENQFDLFGKSLIGYKARTYLTALGVDDTTQVKFYQGFIQDKGTHNALAAMGNVSFNNVATDVAVTEEWAFRVGEYGALSTNQFIEIELLDSITNADPFSIELTNESSTADMAVSKLYRTSEVNQPTQIFLPRSSASNYTNDVKTAGFARLDEVDYTLFDINDLAELNTNITNIGAGTTIWCAKGIDSNWNVYRACDTGVNVITISNALDGLVACDTDSRHGLSENDFIAIKDAGRFTGFYKIVSVPSLKSFILKFESALNGFTTVDTNAPILKLVGLKFNYASELAEFKLMDGWDIGEHVWVTNATPSGWSVYEKGEHWAMSTMLPVGGFAPLDNFGSSLALGIDNKTALVGKSNYKIRVDQNNPSSQITGTGKLISYVAAYDGSLVEDISLVSTSKDTYGLGASMKQGTDWIVIGAPESATSRGYAFLAKRQVNGQIAFDQVLASPESASTTAGDQFGYAVAISRDDQWVYVSAPGADTVYAYMFNSEPTIKRTVVASNNSTTVFPLTFVPASTESLVVTHSSASGSTERMYVPNVEYTIGVDPARIIFTEAPPAGTLRVEQKSGYRYVGKINGTSNTSFGYSLATTTDGAQVAIGAPAYNEEAGRVQVYDRSIEAFLANGSRKTFNLKRTPSLLGKVRVNGELKTLDVDYTINTTAKSVTFTVTPTVSDVIEVETNEFNLIQTLVPASSTARAQFGHSLDICSNNCSVYVGAPYHSDGNYHSGAVYRFLNQGRVYGTITGTVQNPVVSGGSSIRINNFEVEFLNGDLTSVVTQINGAKIPGITALATNGYLTINSSIVAIRNRVRILPGRGNAIIDLGLEVFPETQFIKHPYSQVNELFGKTVRISDNATTLVVGSEYGTTYTSTTFDNRSTLFDANSTSYRETVYNSGAVYVFDMLGDVRNTIDTPSKLAFVQQLVPTNATTSQQDLFGHAVDIRGTQILVGAPGDSTLASNAGQVYSFSNTDNMAGWTAVRSETDKVDLDCINRFYLYSASQNLILESLDYIDPAKGKILGEAEQEIKFKTAYDPAVYNSGTSTLVSMNDARHWSDKQAGQVWWNLSTVRFIDYEQGPVSYRSANWGKMFPGSEITICEWVESQYLPSEYTLNGGDGVPLYEDDSAYVTVEYADPVTNGVYMKYFYWVKDRSTVDTNQFGRSIPVLNVKHLIENPKGQDVKYAAAVDLNAVSLFNTTDLVSGNDTILHVDYDAKINTDVIHCEWELVSEDASSVSEIPARVYTKIIDSLAGADVAGNSVPDPSLPVQDRYGLETRPRQTVFVNREAAVKILVDRVNAFFADKLASEMFDLSGLDQQEEIPPAYSGDWDLSVPNFETLNYLPMLIQPVGYKVLVESDINANGLWTIYTKTANNKWSLTRVQAYNTTEYWEYIDWYLPGFSQYTVPNYTVSTMRDLETMVFKPNDIVKVRNDGTGRFRLFKVSQVSLDVVGVQNGTIELSSRLYDLTSNNLGYGNDNFDTERFDQNTSIELRLICETLGRKILVGQYSTAFTKIFFGLMNYIMTEQKYVDWMFKTSFVSVLHKLRRLTQPAVYIKDNQDYYLEYIEEVKPYHTTVREYVIDYEGTDNVHGYVTDFDVPAIFDTTLGLFRSPSGDFVHDATTIQYPAYQDWKYSYKYAIEEIVVSDGGEGYTLPPTITIAGSTLDYNATARALVSGGKIISVIITNPGAGYVSQPTFTISGGGGTGGKLYAKMRQVVNSFDALTGEPADPYNLVRSMTTKMTFDRINYTSNVKTWKPNTTYEPYSYSEIGWYDAHSALYYTPDHQVPTLAALATLAFTNGDIVKVINDGTGQSRLVKMIKGVVAYRGTAYSVDQTFTSGQFFDANNLTEYDISNFKNANDRIMAYYTPSVGLPGADVSLLQSGISYPGVNVSGPQFSESPFFDSMGFDSQAFDSFQYGPDGTVDLNQATLDTIIQSQYGDELLGNRPEDIVVDGGGDIVNGNIAININKPITFTGGGGFVNTYASHAPEELIPGIVFDTLDMQVHQAITSDLTLADPNIQGVTIQYVTYKVNGTNTYSFDLGAYYNDVLFVYTRLSGALRDGTDYTVDYANKTFTITKSMDPRDIVYLYLFNQVGAGKLNEVVYVADGEANDFDVGVPASQVGSLLVMMNGVRTDDYYVEDNGFNARVVFDTVPADQAYIHILTFAANSIQPYSEIYRQTAEVTVANPSSADFAIELDRSVFSQGPLDTQVVVEINKTRLRPSTCAYYRGDSSTVNFAGPTTDADVNAATILDTDVSVFVDGVLKNRGTDYTVPATSVGAPSITFAVAPADKSFIVISVTKFATYTVYPQSLVIHPSAGLKQNDVVTITSFANHDTLGIKTRVFVGNQATTVSIDAGFDNVRFDQIGYESPIGINLLIPEFEVGTNFKNVNYLWVTLNGHSLMPYYDFVVDGSKLILSDEFVITESDAIMVTDFGVTAQPNPISWRVFKDMTGKVEYLRMAVENVTTLAEDLNITDTTIVVTDASVLPRPDAKRGIPGVIFINGERITYYTIDRNTNTLGQLRRGTGGTGAPGNSAMPGKHPAGSRVVDSSIRQTVPGTAEMAEVARSFLVDGEETNFVFATLVFVDPVVVAGSENPIEVYVNNVLMDSSEYTIDSLEPVIVTFDTAPAKNSIVKVKMKSSIWYEHGETTASNALGLVSSNTAQAKFLKAKSGFLP